MFRFESDLVRLPGKIAWTVFFVPSEFTAAVKSKGRINVTAVIEEGRFRITLLPSKGGHYAVYNRAIREHCRKDIGDRLSVEMEVDDAPRELVVPPDVAEALSSKPSAAAKWDGLADYIKRESVARIEDARTTETRAKRIAEILRKLAG